MNSNYEAVSSLIELLVKKAGFDITKDYSETELKKTRETIDTLLNKKTTATNKKTVASIIDSLKLREANWENNAEIVGKELLNAYKEGKDYNSVKDKIELLGRLASGGSDPLSVGSVYDKLKTIENKYNKLMEKINTFDYSNKEEREMDERYKSYLENKIISLDSEIASLDNELDSLREVETKDESIVNELKDYLNKLNNDRDRINKALTTAIDSDVQLDIWQRLENAKTAIREKIVKSQELLKRTEEMIEDVKNTRMGINDRKMTLNNEKVRCTNKLNAIENKISDGKYESSPERMIDVNNSEILKLQINNLSNKKDVVYVDANKVKEELIKEWTNVKTGSKVSTINKEEVPIMDDISNDIELIEEDLQKSVSTSVNEEIPVEPKEEVKHRSKLDKIEEDLQQVIDKSQIIRDNIVDNTSHTSVSVSNEVTSEPISQPVVSSSTEVKVDEPEILDVIDDIALEVATESVEEVKQEKKNKIELDW